MRFYEIQITNPKTGAMIRPKSWEPLKLDATYSSYVNGLTLPGALNVELDMPMAPFGLPKQGAYVKIWGVSWEEIAQSNDLTGCNVTIFAGMKKGLPLAKPAQSRFPLVQNARILQAFGNREDKLQSLDLVLQPSVGTLAKPLSIVIDWDKKTLAAALETTFRTSFPAFSRVIAISDSLKMSSQQPGTYKTLQGLASEIKVITQDKQFQGIRPLGGGQYTGVDIYVKGKTIFAVDGTKDVGQPTFNTPLQIAFEDLIGQPTWIAANRINFKTVMRSDIGISDYIRLPANLGSPFVLTQPGNSAFSGVPARSQSTFKGKFWIKEKHEFGNFRQPDARSWVSSINAEAVPLPKDTSGSASP